MRIDQLLVSASPGDAVTNAAFELRALLRRRGSSDIYARYFDPALAGDVFPLDRYESDSDENVLCFHASIGEPDVMAFLRGRHERLMVVYHNISPSEPFRPYDARFAGLLDLGRQELAELADRAFLALAVSEYNAAELRALGYQDVRVSPLIVDLTRLTSVEPHATTMHHLRTTVKGPMVLFVGQLLPHKRPDLLVQAFHVLVTYLEPEAHLVLAGPGRLWPYRQAVETLVHELNLAQVWVAGAVSEAELAAFYRRADLFVTASEHEGFCAPLVEAMAFEAPIVARAHAAVPETLGDAGVLLPPDDDPVLLAEAMAAVVGDAPLADELRARGRTRLESFAPDRARAIFLRHLEDVLG
jgi:glycosyltransferase involved in cell wall biosynthesis